jgi:hypothetical protein
LHEVPNAVAFSPDCAPRNALHRAEPRHIRCTGATAWQENVGAAFARNQTALAVPALKKPKKHGAFRCGFRYYRKRFGRLATSLPAGPAA